MNLIALQLWSVKDACQQDFFAVLEKIAEMGYEGVEFAGYHEKSAGQIKEKLAELNLKAVASHLPAEQIFQHPEEVIAFEKELGNKYIVCPWASFETKEEWKHFAQKLQLAAKQFQDAGLTLVYHNHWQELRKFDETYILDFLLQEAPDVMAELDTYWIQYAGADVFTFLAKYKNRTPLIHLKDMKKDPLESTEIGNGSLDIAGFVNQAQQNGTEWLIVEQEDFAKPPLDSVKICLKNLRKILKKTGEN
ncbi:sugar phosphate isomerase/epimerase [Bacillaceae bacterium Marseille-Q3522]|nr:sugar phosphate isomerase/epimerase [Bacillaceae bacterium Marseille-Q3522]